MRINKIIIIAVILFSLPLYSYASKLGVPRINLIEGDVQIKSENATQWMSALMNMPLMEGDEIQVPDEGRLEIQLSNGSFLRFDEYSSFILQSTYTDDFRIYLMQGQAYVNLKGKDSVIQINTPISFARADERAKFRISLLDDDNLEVSVFNGHVYAESRDGMTKVYAGKTLSISEDLYADISPLGLSDEWERWNRKRDRLFERPVYSSRYLPDKLRIYSHDFDGYGEWLYTWDYGYVWKPKLVVSLKWSPYRIGRWMWINDDYVWISREPWGWVPYHYGRWTHTVSLGWFWVPPVKSAVYWGPGFVGWVYTPTYVAWVPLAPKDVYYGYGYYGPRSVNIININIRKRPGKIVYKNVYINNAVTVVYRDSFIRGKHRYFRIKRNPFLRKRVYFGRPIIKQGEIVHKTVVKKIPRKYAVRQERIKKVQKRQKFLHNRLNFERHDRPQKIVDKARTEKRNIIKKSRRHQYRDDINLKQTKLNKKRYKQDSVFVERNKRYKKPVMSMPRVRYAEPRYKSTRPQTENRQQLHVRPIKKQRRFEYNNNRNHKEMKADFNVAKWSQKKFRGNRK